MLVFAFVALIATVNAEYILPCTVGSLRSGNYMVNGSYFCTEPIKTKYDQTDRWTPAGVNSSLYGNYEIYKYMNNNATPIDALFEKVKHQPCNCYNQRIQWKSEILEIKIENKISQGFVNKIQIRDNKSHVTVWDPYIDGTPCSYAQLGYTWSVASEELPDPLILTIPPGNEKAVIKTGPAQDQFLVSGANPVGCGIATRDVYQSVFIPSTQSSKKPNVSLGSLFFERPGSMPISDYCLFSKPQSPTDWSTLTQTQRVFKATVLRLAAAVNTVKECVDGSPEALLRNIYLLSGFRENPSNNEYSMGEGGKVYENYNGVQSEVTRQFGYEQSPFPNDNSLQLCSTKAILTAIKDAVHNMNIWMTQYTSIIKLDFYEAPIFAFESISTTVSSLTYTIQEIIYTGQIDITVTENKVTFDYTNSDNFLKSDYPGSLLNPSRDVWMCNIGKTVMVSTYVPDMGTVQLPTDRGYTLIGDFIGKFMHRDSWNSFITGLDASSASMNYRDIGGDDFPISSSEWPCNEDYLQIKESCLSTCIGKSQKSGKVGCNKDRIPLTKGGNGAFFEFECGSAPPKETYTFPDVPLTTVYSSQEGKRVLATQLNAIFAYYDILDLIQNVGALNQFITFLKKEAAPSIDISDLVPSDFLSTQGTNSDNKVSYGIFDTAVRGPLSLDSDTDTFKYNPFMPQGETTYLPDACFTKDTKWKSGGNTINIAKPGTLDYFTSEQIKSEYGTFLSDHSTTNDGLTISRFGNGFVTNLMAFYTQMEIAIDNSLVNKWKNGGLSDEELVGYSNENSENSDFYDTLLDTNCNPKNNPMESFYFAPRSQDKRTRIYQHIHVPAHNTLKLYHYHSEEQIIKTQPGFNPNEKACFVSSASEINNHPILTNTNDDWCVISMKITGNEAQIWYTTFYLDPSTLLGKCVVLNHTYIMCYCEAQIGLGCNTPPPIAELLSKARSSSSSFDYTFNTNLNPTTNNTNASMFDNVHCHNESIDDNDFRLLEQKLFLDPEYTGNDPPGLSKEQLNAWCATFPRENCTGFKQTDQSYAMCDIDLTTTSSPCKLRTYNYGFLTEDSAIDTTYDVPFSQCNYWNSELDNPTLCQRPDKFTGCVLVKTLNVPGNESAQDFTGVSEFTGASVRVPNSFERLVAANPNHPNRYFATMHSLFFTLARPEVLNEESQGDDMGECSCRYINENGIKTDFTVSIEGFFIVNLTYSQQRQFITQRNKNYFHNVFVHKLPTPITLTIPPVEQIGTKKIPAYDYSRAAIRCDCEHENLFLANNAFGLMHYMYKNVFGNPGTNTKNTDLLPLSCVPFNEKIRFEDDVDATQNSNIGPLIAKGNVYKTRPVDCNALSYRSTSDAKIQKLYEQQCSNQISDYGGICTDLINSNNGGLCNFANSWFANTGSTIPLSTHWSQSIKEDESLASYFFDINTPHTPCTQSSTRCGIMMDKTYMIPCSILAETSIPECSKPQLQLIYPAFDPASPESIGVAVNFPTHIWKWNQQLPAFDENGAATTNFKNVLTQQRLFTNANWDRQLTMIHYCDKYFDSYVFCENDPISATQRQRMCNEKNASIIYAGTVLNDLGLQDICPFVFTGGGGHKRECFVFPGSPKFGSIRSIMAELNARNLQASDITFYYVPFSIAALKNIYMNAAFGDTLITNRFSAKESEFIDNNNKNQIGINAQMLSNPLLKAMAEQQYHYRNENKPDAFFIENQQAICNRQIPLSKTVIDLYFRAINHCFNPASGLYEFVVVQTSANQTIQNVVKLSKDVVFPATLEAGTPIRENDIKIEPAVNPDNYTITFSTRANNTIFDCTRFIVDAGGFSISNMVFNQTNCQHLHESARIPIVFTGDHAENAFLSELKAIDAPVMTAIYGGSSSYGVYSPFIDGSNMEISSFTMQYSKDTTLSPILQNNAAVLGRTIGTISANSCIENHCVVSYAMPNDHIAACNIHYCGCNLTMNSEDCINKQTSQCSENTMAGNNVGFSISSPNENESVVVTGLTQSWFDAELPPTYDYYFIHNGKFEWTVDADKNVVVRNISIYSTKFIHWKNGDGVCIGDPLVLGSACYITTREYNDDSQTDKCIAIKPDNSLFVTDCRNKTKYNDDLLMVYTDILHNRVHQSGNPFMCFTARNDLSQVVLEPCEPCNIGTETHTPCSSDPELSQWITDENASTPVLTIHENIQGVCKTLNKTSGNTSFLPCDTCSWEREKFAIGKTKRTKYKSFCKNAIGIQRFACNSLSTAEIYTTSGKTPSDICGSFSASDTIHELDSSQFGIGAKLYCDQNYKPTWIDRGYGYFENDLIETFNGVTAQTKKIIIQPYTSTGFNVASQGYQVINISTYTGFFGKAYEANIFAAPLRPNNAFWTINIIMAIINGSLILLHIALTIYERELKEHFASPALE